jgi:hypothetical protein
MTPNTKLPEKTSESRFETGGLTPEGAIEHLARLEDTIF